MPIDNYIVQCWLHLLFAYQPASIFLDFMHHFNLFIPTTLLSTRSLCLAVVLHLHVSQSGVADSLNEAAERQLPGLHDMPHPLHPRNTTPAYRCAKAALCARSAWRTQLRFASAQALPTNLLYMQPQPGRSALAAGIAEPLLRTCHSPAAECAT